MLQVKHLIAIWSFWSDLIWGHHWWNFGFITYFSIHFMLMPLVLHHANGMRKIYQIPSYHHFVYFFLPTNGNSFGCLSFEDVYSHASFHASPHIANKLYIWFSFCVWLKLNVCSISGSIWDKHPICIRLKIYSVL